MESLVRYKRLLLQNHTSILEEKERSELREECLRLLSQLKEYDPQRRRRYDELGMFLSRPALVTDAD